VMCSTGFSADVIIINQVGQGVLHHLGSMCQTKGCSQCDIYY